jgi:hypothetical protein
VSPRAGLDVCEKSRPHGDSIPRPSSPYSVAIPTELPGPVNRINILQNLHHSTLNTKLSVTKHYGSNQRQCLMLLNTTNPGYSTTYGGVAISVSAVSSSCRYS